MSEETELLIEKMQIYVYLFDTSHEYYKNVAKKAEAWNEIAAELNITSKHLFNFTQNLFKVNTFKI